MRQRSRPSPTLFALAALLACLAQGAGAAPVALSANSASSANGVVGDRSISLLGIPTTTGIQAQSNRNDLPSSGAGVAFANNSGAYAVNSQAQGVGTGSASTSLTYLFTNAGAGSNFTANFHLYGGRLISFIDSPLTGVEQLSASYTATIKVNGIQAFSSSASLLTTATGSTLTTSGTRLDAADDGTDGVYDWSATDITLDLGFVGAGQTVEILADLASAASANVGTYDFVCGVSNCTRAKGSVSARYGDPLTFTGAVLPENAVAPANQGQVTAVSATVPEPSALALSALALGALLATRRRQRVAG